MKAATARTRTQIKNILFATDFSPAATAAIPYAREIARHFGADLHALHVRPPIVSPVTSPFSWAVEREAAQVADHEHRTALLGAFAEIRTEVLIEEGDIQSSLTSAIHKDLIDLVVIGTRGRSGLGKLLLGSVAEEIFREVSCPVLTVGPHSPSSPAPDGRFREILYATDFSPESEAAAAYAVSLAQEFQARLTLMHVISEQKTGELVSAGQLTASIEQLLRKLVPPEAESWCKPEVIVESGDAAEKILEVSKQRNTDLIVLGVKPESGIPGAGTHLPIATAHKIVSHAICPVLTVRGQAV
jgi:nucleotide-binding universal stress UspA family protein